MARVNVFLDEELLDQADREARRTGLKRSALVQEALREYLERNRIAREEEARRRGQKEASEKMDRLAERLGAWDTVRTVREGRDRRSPASR